LFQIVKLIKESPTRPVTAAVGDGANDISMIQEAHVGFGIFGREGHQAAR
jgi:phospholipid-translocating ATPase